jgi:hypothetical protein
VQDRVQSRHNLKQKNILESADCSLYGHHDETTDHIIFSCPTAAVLWNRLGVVVTSGAVRALWDVPLPSSVPVKHRTIFLFLCCWHVWKHWSAVVFEALSPYLGRLLQHARDDARLWAARLPREDAPIVESWCYLLFPM